MFLGTASLGINQYGGLGPVLDLQFLSDSSVAPSITFSGGAGGTYTDATGVIRPQRGNLALWSQHLTGVPAWTISGAVTVTDNATAAPDGTTTAANIVSTNAGYSVYNQPITVVPGQTYTLSFYVKDHGSTEARYRVYDQTHAADITWTSYLPSINSSTYTRITVTFTVPAGCTNIAVYPASGTGVTNVYVWGHQLEPGSIATPYIPTTSAAVYAPRIDASGVSRTNLVPRSQDMQTAPWTTFNTTVSADVAVAPDGTLTADKILDTVANADHRHYNTLTVTNGAVYTASVYLKAAERSVGYLYEGAFVTAIAYFDLNAGTVSNVSGTGSPSARMVAVGNGWYRCSLTFTAGGASANLQFGMAQSAGTSVYAGTGTSGIYAWGAQLETGTVATDYIWTTSAAATVPAVRTNLAPNSANQAAWSGSGTAVASSATAPDGSSGASKVTTSSVSAYRQISCGTVGAGTYVASMYVQYVDNPWFELYIGDGTGTNYAAAWFNVQTGVAGALRSAGSGWTATAMSIVPLANGFYRVTLLFSAPSGAAVLGYSPTSASNVTTTLSGVNVVVWGAQLEAGASATAYIPTTSAAASSANIAGMLVEEQRTNSLRNSTMQGAASGTPGTNPTNWALALNGITGLTTTLTTGSEGGLSTLDLRVQGTPSATAAVQLFMETTTGIAATAGQAWTYSAYLSLIAGSFTNVVSTKLDLQTYTSVPAFIQDNLSAALTVGSGALLANRQSAAITIAGASTASTRPCLQFNLTSGQVVDFTVRIGGPQVELGAFATSFIPTTSAAVTRTQDSASITGANFTSPFNPVQGTIVLERTPLRGAGTGSYQVMQVDDSSNANRILFGVDVSTGIAYGQFVTATVPSMQANGGAVSAGAPYKIGLAYGASGFSVSKDGGAVASVSTTLPSGINRLNITNDHVSNPDNGWIKRIRVSRTQLPAATLQSVVT